MAFWEMMFCAEVASTVVAVKGKDIFFAAIGEFTLKLSQ